jgi:hypothetical protein
VRAGEPDALPSGVRSDTRGRREVAALARGKSDSRSAGAYLICQAGVLKNKHNAVADILTASAFFRGLNVDSKHLITPHDKLPHLNGFSSAVSLFSYCAGAHGAMLALEKKPEAFDAAVLRGGVFDMVRLHDNGGNPKTTEPWCSLYGNIKSATDRIWMADLDPLSNVKTRVGLKKGDHAILFDVSDSDGTVYPLHSIKQTAELQYKNPENAEGKSVYRVELSKSSR